MVTLLAKPWKVDERGERLYVYVDGREVCVDICSGLPEDRRRVLALLAQVPEMAKALEPLARFAAAFDAKPIRGIDDALYGIHGGDGMPGGVDVRLSDLRRALKVLRDAGLMSDPYVKVEGQ